ncbi:MAG: hypothetical protein ACOY6E_09940 [Pseudomonadota bacterium]|jgi:hypothetical protein
MAKWQIPAGATRAIWAIAAAGVLAFVLARSGPAKGEQRIFRYRDTQGVIHLAGVLPPGQAQAGYEILDATTLRSLSVVAPMPTAQQQTELEQAAAADAAARREQEDRQRQAAVRQQRDTMLLQTYASEAELLAMRDDKLASFGLIQGTVNKTIGHLRSNLAQMNAVIAEHQAAGRDAPSELRTARDQTAADLAEQESAAGRLQTERTALRAQFEDDLQRYRALTAPR